MAWKSPSSGRCSAYPAFPDMASVTETIVREYFELLGFLVRQERKYVSPARQEEDDGDFLVIHPQPRLPLTERPFVLDSLHLQTIPKAVVGVKGWHTEVISPARLETAPEILRFVEPPAWRRALRALGSDPPPCRILVLSGLPRAERTRQQTIELLRSKGVDGVLPFRTILAELVGATEPNRNYVKSDLLQTLRILKRYGFLTLPQMELFGREKKLS